MNESDFREQWLIDILPQTDNLSRTRHILRFSGERLYAVDSHCFLQPLTLLLLFHSTSQFLHRRAISQRTKVLFVYKFWLMPSFFGLSCYMNLTSQTRAPLRKIPPGGVVLKIFSLSKIYRPYPSLNPCTLGSETDTQATELSKATKRWYLCDIMKFC